MLPRATLVEFYGSGFRMVTLVGPFGHGCIICFEYQVLVGILFYEFQFRFFLVLRAVRWSSNGLRKSRIPLDTGLRCRVLFFICCITSGPYDSGDRYVELVHLITR